MDLLNGISTLNLGKPLLIEVSINGKWENPWIIPLTSSIPSPKEVDAYVKKGTDGIAIEIFLKSKDASNIFFGIRFGNGLLVSTPKEFLMRSFQSIWETKNMTFKDLVKELEKRVVGSKIELFQNLPTSIELGVVNAWNSMGSVDIWNNQQVRKISNNLLLDKLKSHKHLHENTVNYVAVEFNYRATPHYWIAIQIADKKDEIWQLNQNKLQQAL